MRKMENDIDFIKKEFKEPKMIIYVHKVRCNPEDGWGRSMGMMTDVLGRYSTKEKAVEAKNLRDSTKECIYHDVGRSWIEEEEVK